MTFLRSIQFRLTIWYLSAVTILLLVFGITAYFMLSYNLYQNFDDSLRARASEVEKSLTLDGNRIVFTGKVSDIVLLYDANGVLTQRLGPVVQFTSIDSLIRRALFGQSSFLTANTLDGQPLRMYAAPESIDGTRIVVVVGRTPAEVTDVLASFRSVLGFSSLAVIVLGFVSGLFLANRALKPVGQITRTAREIGGGDLSRRIKVIADDELGRLAATLNGMIERLEAAFNRQRQFTADASHELRTPLAVMQAESTLSLEKERTAAEYRKSLELVSQEVAYMSAIISKLLFLARSDAGKELLTFEPVNLRDLVTEVTADIEVLAKDKELQFSLGQMEELTVKGDRVKLRQLMLNLLENAVKYTPGGGNVSASIVRRKNMAQVAICDTGLGIPAEHLPLIFDRFHRVDKARSRAEGGAGLGLAIAKYIADIHGGQIEVQSEVGKGSTFTVSIPLLGQEHPLKVDKTGADSQYPA